MRRDADLTRDRRARYIRNIADLVGDRAGFTRSSQGRRCTDGPCTTFQLAVCSLDLTRLQYSRLQALHVALEKSCCLRSPRRAKAMSPTDSEDRRNSSAELVAQLRTVQRETCALHVMPPTQKTKAAGKKKKQKKAGENVEDDVEVVDEARAQRTEAAIMLQSYARRRRCEKLRDELAQARLAEQEEVARDTAEILRMLDEEWLAGRRAVGKAGYPGSLAPPQKVAAELQRFAALRRLPNALGMGKSGYPTGADGDTSTSGSSSDYGIDERHEPLLW